MRRRAVRSGAAVEWGCCHALPTKYVDRYGFRRQLRDELAILERDAGWLRAEHPAAREAPVVRLADPKGGIAPSPQSCDRGASSLQHMRAASLRKWAEYLAEWSKGVT